MSVINKRFSECDINKRFSECDINKRFSECYKQEI